jgi:small subunit ribosomal protein S18
MYNSQHSAIPQPPQAAPAKRPKPNYLKTGADGNPYVDYKAVDDLRRLMTPNGKIYSRKRLNVSAREQRMVSQAIKRARYMALLPYTDATL